MSWAARPARGSIRSCNVGPDAGVPDLPIRKVAGHPGQGAVYVFTRAGATWSEQAYLKAANAQAGDNFGASVAISGDTIADWSHARAAPWQPPPATF